MDHERATESESAETAVGSGTRTLLLGFALVLIAAVAYANAAFHPFVYDDLPLVLKNPVIRSLANLPQIAGLVDGGFQLNTRWTRTATYALEFAVAGTWAPLYHMTNIALHAAVGLLVFALVGRLASNTLLGWWTAALFIVHPIQTEVVAHVAGRRGLLAALFSLTALVLLERFTRLGGMWRLGLAVVAIYFGVFSKELAVMTPLAFIAIDLWASWRRAAPGSTLRSWLGEHVGQRWALYGLLVVVAGCLAGAVLFLSPDVGLGGSPGVYDTVAGGLGWLERASLTGMGVRLLLLPVGLSVDYSFDALEMTSAAGSLRTAVDVGVLVLAVGVSFWGLWRRNWAGFAGAWFLLFYLPHIGLIPWHEVFAERFLYLPSIGFCAAAAAAGLYLARSWKGPVTAVGVLVLALLTGLTVVRNEAWGSPQALWESAVNRYPRSARAQKALGDAYLEATRADLALAHYQAAIEILPQYLDARTGIAVTHVARREFADALETLDGILQDWPHDAKALNTKAYVHETLGDMRAAMDTYQRAVDSDPSFADGYNNLGRLYVYHGDLDMAVRMYETALEHNPAMVRAMQNLALVYREGFGDEEKANWYESQARKVTTAR